MAAAIYLPATVQATVISTAAVDRRLGECDVATIDATTPMNGPVVVQAMTMRSGVTDRITALETVIGIDGPGATWVVAADGTDVACAIGHHAPLTQIRVHPSLVDGVARRVTHVAVMRCSPPWGARVLRPRWPSRLDDEGPQGGIPEVAFQKCHQGASRAPS